MTEPKLDFGGRSALVTGAGSGIGAAVARWLDAHGIETLHLVDVKAEGIEQVAPQHERAGDEDQGLQQVRQRPGQFGVQPAHLKVRRHAQ